MHLATTADCARPSVLPPEPSLSLSPHAVDWAGPSVLSLLSRAARQPGKIVRDAALPSQGPRTASRPWEDSRAHGGSDGQRWDSGTASRAPMPASRQPTASRFLGSVVRGFAPLLQLTRRPLRDILLQPCDDNPLGFLHRAGIGGGLAALNQRPLLLGRQRARRKMMNGRRTWATRCVRAWWPSSVGGVLSAARASPRSRSAS